ncbi:alpha/beta fold hydrolase [Bacillus sp. AFS002410]|uniref:alpha/beta fold hydrolase n=1 Tax=Bacillus sp. AFS002410 TaxID=2033481 RepID=UPI00211D705B|nr:alpha/beta hydrolase [Bacillus sp. AFS002410]
MTSKKSHELNHPINYKHRNMNPNLNNPYYYHQNWHNEYQPYPIQQEYHLNDKTDFFYRQHAQLIFVLVHGSWVDPFFWHGITRELQKMGHIVHTPQLPGHGTDKDKNVNHEILTKQVVHYITSNKLNNIILVGHNLGGTVIQKVAEQLHDRIKRLVFWNAFVLNDGESLVDQYPAQAQKFLLGLAQQSTDNTIKLPFQYFRDVFVNLADLQTAQQIYSATTPEPATPLFEKLDLKTFYQLSIPRSFINLQEDTAVPAGENSGWYPYMASKLGVYRFIQGSGDHMSTAKLYSRRIAQLIISASRD